MYYLVQFSKAAFVASVKVKVKNPLAGVVRSILLIICLRHFCILWPLIILISTGSSLQLLLNMVLTRIQVLMLHQNTDVK